LVVWIQYTGSTKELRHVSQTACRIFPLFVICFAKTGFQGKCFLESHGHPIRELDRCIESIMFYERIDGW